MPNVMLLLDTSGSMSLPLNPTDAACPTSCGSTTANPCPQACPTRISTLRSALADWLATRGTTLRLGLTSYPAGTLCQPPTASSVSLPPAASTDQGQATVLQQHATSINTTLANLIPTGGTPTAAALDFVRMGSALTSADGRDDYVVLVTDGLPNCNDLNPNALCTCGTSCTAQQTSACACTTSSCAGPVCAKGCLDADGAIAATAQLRTAGVKTLVISLGSDTLTGAAPAVLDGMARAGGLAKGCPNGTAAECGVGGMCRSDRTCTQGFYGATSAAELRAALDVLR